MNLGAPQTAKTGVAAVALLVALLILPPRVTLGHADLETSSPPAGGSVTALPASMTLTFSEEVRPGAASVQVTGPGGDRVDQGDAAVDLADPGRVTVRVSLFAGGPGEYAVHWETVSNIDGDRASGDYAFMVAIRAGSSLEASVGTPEATTIAPEPTPTAENFGNPLASTEGDFDSRAFALSIGAGLLALAAIAGFWFVIRPRNPRFGQRSGPGAR